MSRSAAIGERARFDFVRYANCWEDAGVLCEALRPRPGMRILSIASAGDNCLALAAEGAEVIAADINPAQLACLELRRAAFRRLEYQELLPFLGVTPADDREETYRLLRADLPDSCRAFFDARPAAIREGVIHAGKFESYFRLFRTRVMPWIHGRGTVGALLAERDAPARHAFYEQHWNGLRWRLLFRVFFSRFVMGRLGRDPEFFRYVEGSVGGRILARTRHALTALATHDNPYLHYILTGTFGPARPRYLEPDRFEAVRDGLDRITVVAGSVTDAAAACRRDGLDGFNLSDVFEYLDPPACRGVYGDLLAVARPGARFAYWNMLAPRRRPDDLADRVASLEEEATRLHEKDRAWFYSAFVLEQVRG